MRSRNGRALHSASAGYRTTIATGVSSFVHLRKLSTAIEKSARRASRRRPTAFAFAAAPPSGVQDPQPRMTTARCAYPLWGTSFASVQRHARPGCPSGPSTLTQRHAGVVCREASAACSGRCAGSICVPGGGVPGGGDEMRVGRARVVASIECFPSAAVSGLVSLHDSAARVRRASGFRPGKCQPPGPCSFSESSSALRRQALSFKEDRYAS